MINVTDELFPCWMPPQLAYRAMLPAPPPVLPARKREKLPPIHERVPMPRKRTPKLRLLLGGKSA